MSRSNTQRRQRVTLMLASAVALPAAIYLARTAHSQGADVLGPPAPPAIAFDVCSLKAATQTCEVSFTDGTKMPGRCESSTDGRLFCRPAAPPGPPPELLKACEGKVEGAPCSGKIATTSFQAACHKDISGRQICR